MESVREEAESRGASPALRQLEQLVRALGDELAGFRRRAQAAESRVRALESAAAVGSDLASLERLRTLEAENAELKARLAFAATRSRQLAARVKFVRQQAARPTGPAQGGSQ
ncbi:MAG: hypothetical protein JNL26_04010 [Gemmatimonadetes bacterium]|nr:hypothetical protein [Gemmatimonadota bacterium]